MGARAEEASRAVAKRAAELGVADFAYAAAPVIFWDLYGEQGHPIRATVAEMGPLLLARDRAPALLYDDQGVHPSTPELWG